MRQVLYQSSHRRSGHEQWIPPGVYAIVGDATFYHCDVEPKLGRQHHYQAIFELYYLEYLQETDRDL